MTENIYRAFDQQTRRKRSLFLVDSQQLKKKFPSEEINGQVFLILRKQRGENPSGNDEDAREKIQTLKCFILSTIMCITENGVKNGKKFGQQKGIIIENKNRNCEEVENEADRSNSVFC